MDRCRVPPNDGSRVTRHSGTPCRWIVGAEPLQRASQTGIGAPIGVDAWSSHLLHWRVLNVLRHHVDVTSADTPSMQDHRGRGRSHAPMWASGRIVGVAPRGAPDLLTDARHHSQVVQPFLDGALCCVHRASSSLRDPPLPHSQIPVHQQRNVGY